MAQITAAQVKELREITGAGMMECKKALVEAEGDLDKAIDVLRTRGLAAVAKKAGRATNEGAILAIVSDDATAGAIIELDCETDFVAINEKFKAYAEKIARAALAAGANDVEACKAADADGETVEAVLTDAIHVMGENIQLARVATVQADGIASYVHTDGKKAVLVLFDLEGIDPTSAEFQTCGRDVAMQAVAMSPIAANREAVDEAVIAHEMEIYKAQAAESGKPEAIQEKIATGRLEKFFKEQCLAEQTFVKDNDMTVLQYVNGVAKKLGGSIKIAGFVRFLLGE
ncbi:MAG: translation elongation factor Ts [Eggerthellaceae bacterium]|nr:translation elongation factor Ts [Eggerthellaceae bacterium]